MRKAIRISRMVALIALAVSSVLHIVFLRKMHRRLEETSRILQALEQDENARRAAIKSGEVCVTWDDDIHLKQHWKPAIHRIGGQQFPDCYESAPTGLKESDIGMLK